MTAAVAEDRDRIGPYRVIKAIGAGGSARIDLARIDRAYGFQRHVVLKRPLEHLRGDKAVAASLRREARIGGRLRHPNLVAILDAGEHDGYDYLVLEYVHGSSLRALMQTEQSGKVRDVPLAVALAVVIDVARGMHEAHELASETGGPLGLVHRDVSPGNILLGLDGTVKLADFGIAKETRVSTLSGSIHGTVTYMAPEQCQGHAFDRRADVFSLGVILYELCTGTRLFWADNDVASLHRVLSGTVPRPRKVKPQLPSQLEDIILAAVAHDPQKRLGTARELATVLEAFGPSLGEIVSPRGIQRAMEEAVGPRAVPWVAAATIPDVPRRGEGSLIDIIAAIPDDEPPSPVFGEISTGAVSGQIEDDLTIPNEDLATPLVIGPSPVPETDVLAKRPRRVVAAIVIAGVTLGSAATALVMLLDRDVMVDRPALPAYVPPTQPPPPVPAQPQPVAQPTAEPLHESEPEVASPPPKKTRPKKHGKRKDKDKDKDKEPAPPVEVVAAPPPVDPTPTPGTGPGSGSAVPHKVEWNDKILFPNEGSGARKSP